MLEKFINIGEKVVVGQDQKPVVVAEVSANHGQSLDSAKELISRIAESGADAIKLQTYTPESMTLAQETEEFRIKQWTRDWEGKTAFELYQVAQTPWDWHPALFDHARALGIEIFSSPFSSDAVDFLESLDCPAYKIASYENTDVNLLRYVAKTGKPIIVSTGSSTLLDVSRAVDELQRAGAEDIILMKCTSSYPAPANELNIRSIPYLSQLFGVPVGFSDHSIGIGAAVASVALGATVIEKHVMLETGPKTPDSHFSLTTGELQQLVTAVSDSFLALNEIPFGVTDSEAHGVLSKRSLFYRRSLGAGEVVTPDSLVCLRPIVGLPASELDHVLGRKLKTSVEEGSPVQSGDLV